MRFLDIFFYLYIILGALFEMSFYTHLHLLYLFIVICVQIGLNDLCKNSIWEGWHGERLHYKLNRTGNIEKLEKIESYA